MNQSDAITTGIVGQRSLFTHYAILVTRTILISGIGFASTVFTYRILSVEGIGLATIYITVRNSLVSLLLLWPVTGFLQYGREEYDRTRQLARTFGTALSIIGILLVATLLGCIFMRNPLMKYIGLPTEWLWLLMLDLSLIAVNRILNQVFYITAKIQTVSILDLLNPLMMLGVVVFVWLSMGRIQVTTFLFVSVISSIVISLSSLFVLRDHIFPLHFSMQEAKRILRFSSFLYCAVIFTFIYDQFDFIIINQYRPSEEIAYYSLAYRVYTYISLLPMLSINVIYPIMVSYRNLGREDLFQKYSARTVPQMFFFWTIGCIALLWILPWTIRFLFGSPYHHSIPCLSIFCLSAIFQFTIACYSPVLLSHEKVRWSLKVNLAGTIIITIGNLLLIPPLGIVGAALATLISYAFNSIAYAYLTTRIIQGRYRGYEIIMALFFLPVVIITVAEVPLMFRILVSIMDIFGMYWWSYRHGLFSTDDLFFMDHVSVPKLVRMGVYRIFQFLEPANVITGSPL